MLPIATSKKAFGGKEQGFEKENTTAIEIVIKSCWRVEILFLQIHKRSKSESADLVLYGTMPIPLLSGSRKKRKKEFL